MKKRIFVQVLSISMLFLSLFLGSMPQTLATEPSTHAVDFGGSDDYIQVADHNSLDVANEVTIAYWIYLKSVSMDAMVLGNRKAFPPPAGGYWFTLRALQKIPCIWYYDNASGDQEQPCGVTVPIGEWHHVVFSFKANDYIQCWQNGVLEEVVASIRNPIKDSNGVLYVANGDGVSTNDLNAILDEIMLFNRTVTEEEALYLYNSGEGSYEPMNKTGLVLWLKFDEGSGTTVRDRSEYGNDGTFSGNDVTWAAGKAPDWYAASGDLYIQTSYFASLSSITYTNSILTFTVDAASGTSSTKVHSGDLGEPDSVTGATSWSYSSTTKITTITVTHSSAEEVELNFQVAQTRTVVVDRGFIAISLMSVGFIVIVAAALWKMEIELALTATLLGTAFIVAAFVVIVIFQALSNI